MPLAPGAVEPLTRRYQSTLTRLGDRGVPIVERLWDDLDEYDEADVPVFAEAVAPTMSALRRGAVASTVGYFDLLFGLSTAVAADAVPVEYDPADPFFLVWRGLQRGVPWAEAVDAGRRQIEATVHHHVMSSARRAGDVYVQQARRRPTRWQRIPDGNACAWCLTVAGDHYLSAESADFGHQRCGCTVVPVLDDFDPSEHVGT